jgi:hypothetical protein
VSGVVEVTMPAVVELTALCIEEVCRVSACVALTLEAVPVITPVGSADRLKLMPMFVVLEVVPLNRLEESVMAVDDGCAGNDQVKLVPEPSLLDGIRDSLAGTCVPDVAGCALEVRISD